MEIVSGDWLIFGGNVAHETSMEGKLQEEGADDKPKSKTFKWKVKGRVVSRGLSQPGEQACTHPTLMKDMCAECGADLRENPGHAGARKEAVSASVAMVHSIPELIVSEEEALQIGRSDEDRLLRTRKLVLLVDLDQTLIHTTNDNIPANLKGVFHFQLAHGNSILWYHTRLRPNTEQFLRNISEMYELHICTFGVRMYAHTIATFLDPEGKYFSHRILSRDECFSFNSKIPNLKALFPCGDSMVCIIDDREDVWSFSPNLIHVKPYRFFQGTADINAPPGCQKTEADANPVKHRVRRISHTSDGNSQVEEMGTNLTGEEGENPDREKESESQNLSITPSDKDNGSKHIMAKDNENKDVSDKCSDGDEVSKNKSDTLLDNDTEGDKTNSESEEAKREVAVVVKGETEDVDRECVSNTEVLTVPDSDAKSDKDKENTTPKADKIETKTTEQSSVSESNVETVSEEIEWVDDDDYLLHLEEILRRVHKAFYDVYDQMTLKGKVEKVPDMKSIIPYVKKKALKGANVLFSGVFPTNMPPEKSRAHIVAKSLGANIHTAFVPKSSLEGESGNHTTHVIAARLGTSKVRAAQKSNSVFLVTPEWLWNCGDRWEHVDERLFPLTEETQASLPNKQSGSDLPSEEPGAVDNGKRRSDTPVEELYVYDRVTGKRIQPNKRQKTPGDGSSGFDSAPRGSTGKGEADPRHNDKGDGKFAESYNPLYAFSEEEIATMDREVEELMEDDEVSSSSEDEAQVRRKDDDLRRIVLGKSLPRESSSEEDSLTGDFPRGWQIKKKLVKLGKLKQTEDALGGGDLGDDGNADREEEEDMRDSDDDAAGKSDQEVDSEKSDDSIGSVDDIIAQAVEKEFLS